MPTQQLLVLAFLSKSGMRTQQDWYERALHFRYHRAIPPCTTPQRVGVRPLPRWKRLFCCRGRHVPGRVEEEAGEWPGSNDLLARVTRLPRSVARTIPSSWAA